MTAGQKLCCACALGVGLTVMGEIVPWVFEEEKTGRQEVASGVVTAAVGTTDIFDTWPFCSVEGNGTFSFLYPGLLIVIR